MDHTDRLLSKLTAQAETLAQLAHQLGECETPESFVATAARLLARLTTFDTVHLLVLEPDGATMCWSDVHGRGRPTPPPVVEHFRRDETPDDVLHWLLALRQSLLVRSRVEIEALPCAEPFRLMPPATESALSTTFDLGHRRRATLAITSTEREHYDAIDKGMFRYFGTTFAGYFGLLQRPAPAPPPNTRPRSGRGGELDALHHPVLLLDVHGRVAATNPAAEAHFRGQRLDQIAWSSLPLPGNGTLTALLDVALSERQPLVHAALDPSGRTWLITLSPLDVGGGAAALELIELPQEVLASETTRAVQQFGRGVAHTYSNIFTGLKMWSQLVTDATHRLLAQTHTDDEVRQTLLDGLSAITDGVERGEHVVDRLADLTGDKRRTTRSNVYDLSAVVDGAVELLHRTHPRVDELQIQVLHPAPVGEPVLVSGDPYGLRTALHQLLANAAEAVERRGLIQLQTTVDRPRGLVRLTIVDDGPGLSAGAVERATQPFFTTRGNLHAGLGLNVAEAILHRLGGTLSLASSTAGTTVTVTLPTLSAPRHTTPRTTGTHSTPTPVALIVAEDTVVLQRQSRLLRSWGVQALTATHGHEAVALAERLSRLDLVLLDQQIPDMAGTSLARVLSASFPTAHIAILTDDPDQRLSDRMQRAGVHQLLPRPLRPVELRELVDALKPA